MARKRKDKAKATKEDGRKRRKRKDKTRDKKSKDKTRDKKNKNKAKEGGEEPQEELVVASEAAIAEWARRVEAEYRSAAIAHHLVLWLIQIGAPPSLIQAGLSVVSQEVYHAELSHNVFRAAGGGSVSPLPPESLSLPARVNESPEVAIGRWCVELFCLRETVGVRLLKALRKQSDVAVARKTLNRLYNDERGHRDFGWALLGYLLAQPYEVPVRKMLNTELPAMFTRLWRSFGPVEETDDATALLDDDRRWGLMEPQRYRELLVRTHERDYRPRFEALGLNIDAAWEHASEGLLPTT